MIRSPKRLTALTVDVVMSWEPCYNRKHVEKLADGRESMSPLEVCDLAIPEADRLWVLLREEILPAHVLYELACQFAERALQKEREAGREPDPRSWAAIDMRRAWLRGETTDEALEVAWAEARAAAWAAARAEAREAASAAAWAAAREAASAAAWAAAREAASAAAREEQLKQLTLVRARLL